MPPTVAVIGASSDRSKFGNKAVRAFAKFGYHVYPIHPRETEVEGWPVFRNLAAVPADALDAVTLYLPPSAGVKVLDEIVGRPVQAVWLNPGADAPEVVARARELGLPVRIGCSIRAIGADPYDLD